MTLTHEPVSPGRNDALLEPPTDVELPPVEPAGRIRWFEWTMAVVFVAVVASLATILMTRSNEPEAEPTLVLGPRHLGVVMVPEYLGASGGDLVAIESSPLVLGPRQLDGVVYVPVFVGHADGVYPENGR